MWQKHCRVGRILSSRAVLWYLVLSSWQLGVCNTALHQTALCFVPTPLRLFPHKVNAAEPYVHTTAKLHPICFTVQQLPSVIGNGVFILLHFGQRRIWAKSKGC